ncbi:mannose-specific lectin-like [Phalaenopsis equestris]|uniref:mannose-specific lectin-like n=1 Tax=Phalaenopsis equestris TaxID=78828 RepID=UPI0009E4F05B|nr:mannose-specific lectin-like [Phalaenopsis equestris]
MAHFFLTPIILLLLPRASSDYVLYNGEVLMPGQNLTNGPHQLSMQPNCDLVLQRSGKLVWTTNSTFNSTNDGDRSCYAALKQNGELVVRRDVHYILWTSAKKAKKGKYVLILDSTGQLGIYGSRRWISSNPKERGPASRPNSAVQTDYVLHSGKKLLMGKKLKYREYELGLSKCNLVINSTRSGRTLWQTNTKAETCFLELENNGELMVKHGSQRIWSSNRKGDKGKYVAVLGFDGRFAVYGPALWFNAKIDDSTGDEYSPIDMIQEEMMMWGMD